MKSPRTELHFAFISAFLLAHAAACGPLGGASEPPPYLELSGTSITFDAEEDSGILEVRNTGGGLISFTAVVSAESGGVTWLRADPTGGTVQGGTSKAVLLTVTNREALQPGTYTGQVSVEAENVDGRSLLVTLIVGQPILETDPMEVLDFDTAATSRSLQVKNTGDGTLVYSVLLPGIWITTTAPLQKTLAAGQSDTLVLGVDRGAVPWYGAGEDEILVTSNGLDDDGHSSTAKLLVKVTTDAHCGSDADCTLPGYFCDDADGDGACALRRDNGSACQSDEQCSSALCVEDVCCNAVCDGPCESCALAATKGTCSPVADGTGCDDGLVCTEDDGCAEGVCLGGPPMDCAAFDNPCGLGVCSESADGCTAPALDDHCVIEGACLDDGDWHPEVPCLRCLSEVAADAWSVIPDRCLVDGACYQADEEIGGPCNRCDPAATTAASPVTDLSPCGDDGNPCTADHCLSGICEHPGLDGEACDDGDPCTHTDICDGGGACAGTPYVCNDGLDCTADACNGDGTCAVETDAGSCVIDDGCVADGAALEASGGCSVCDAVAAPGQWSWQPDAFPCDDGDLCTDDDACLEGLCLGQLKDCDDGAECTADSCVAGTCAHDLDEETCLIQGVCVSDGAASESSPCQACQSALATDAWSPYNVGTPCDLPNAVAQCGEAGDCVLIACSDALYGDCNLDPADGCEAELWQDLMHCGGCDDPCVLPNAWTACAGGQCSFVACHEGFKECDGEEATGCEAHTASDPTNCGECGLLCDTSNPAKVGVCEESACALVFCDPDTFNLDGDPANGCECAVDGEELCNDTDDDCDGEVDEGFDLASDLENCGACGVACDLPDVAAAACVNGTCVIAACPPDLYNRNGDPADGCEHTVVWNGELWVDALNGGGPDADGSQTHPFASIQEAVDAADPSNLIHVLEGAYMGGIVVDQPGIVIRGAGPDQVQISTPDDDVGITVTADDVTVLDLRITSGAEGVRFQGDPLVPLEGGLVANTEIIGLGRVADSAGQVAGVFAEYTTGVAVTMVELQDLSGGLTGSGGGGDPVVGVMLSHAGDTVVAGCAFSEIAGGDVGTSMMYYCGSAHICGPVPSGGIAAAVLAAQSPGLRIVGNAAAGLSGGTGAPKYNGGASAGAGGIAAGVHLTESPAAHLSGNAFTDVVGGTGGSDWTFVAQQAYGVYLDEASFDAEVALTNSVNGDPIVFLSGVDGVTVEGLSQVSPAQPTNHGKIVVVDSAGVEILDNFLAQARGETGATVLWYNSGYTTYPGGPARGIYLTGCDDCLVRGNLVNDVLGGRGGFRSDDYNPPGSDGGPGTGIEAVDCAGLEVTGNEVRQVTGHRNGAGQYCAGGDAAGYRISGSEGVTFRNNRAQTIHTLAWNDQYSAHRDAVCVRVEGSEPLAIDHLTCLDVGGEASPGYGVLLDEAQLNQVSVRNSIIASVSRFGLKGIDGVSGILTAYYSLFHNCTEGTADDATLVSCIEDEDPLFVLPQEWNLHLQPGSPAIDAGNPATVCTLEPVPNGCRVNLGAYGGTAEAASAPGADHCSPCP